MYEYDGKVVSYCPRHQACERGPKSLFSHIFGLWLVPAAWDVAPGITYTDVACARHMIWGTRFPVLQICSARHTGPCSFSASFEITALYNRIHNTFICTMRWYYITLSFWEGLMVVSVSPSGCWSINSCNKNRCISDLERLIASITNYGLRPLNK